MSDSTPNIMLQIVECLTNPTAPRATPGIHFSIKTCYFLFLSFVHTSREPIFRNFQLVATGNEVVAVGVVFCC